MAREKWLVDPAEYDEFQREIAGLDINDSFIIKGCAGSGKTILALDRVNNIRIAAMAENEFAYPSFSLVVYTKALRSFIQSGALEKGISLDQVVHYAKWDKRQIDYLVIDEAQDFKSENIDTFLASKNKSIMLYGDSQQQLYPNTQSIEETVKKTGITSRELIMNYRLPKLIAEFAVHLADDKKLVSQCAKTGAEKPRIKKSKSWQEELDYIIKEINTRGYTDVAILLPFNIPTKAPKNNGHRNVQNVKDYFDLKSFRHQAKIREDENTDTNELDFDSDLPKVMTYHSAKGLQFETVFIPFCDCPNYYDFFTNNYKKPLYVALTRTYRNLYLTYTGYLTQLFDGIPVTSYEKI